MMHPTRMALVAVIASLTVGALGCAADTSSQPDLADDTGALTDGIPLSNFAKVNDHIYRGGRPDAQGVAYLKSIGVHTVLSLELGDGVEARPSQIAQEGVDVTKAGLDFRHVPITSFDPAVSDDFDAKMDTVLATFKDPATWPVYVHCRRGKDRTGLAVALERVLQEPKPWTPQAAYAEWKQYGLMFIFLNLEEYFRRKTGWTD